MVDTTADVPAREPFFITALKSTVLLRESVVGMIGGGIIVFWILVAVFADLLAPFGPLDTMQPLAPPGTEFIIDANHQFMKKEAGQDLCKPIIENGAETGKFNCGTFWLGADLLGRDILSRIIYGSRQVLLIAPFATLCAYLVGVPMGLAAGYRRGWVDATLSFAANVILAFPVLVLFIIIISLIGASVFNIIVAIVFASGPGIMRIVRGLALDLRNREYVFAAQTRGESAWYIMLVEILPNARGPLIVDFCVRIGYVTISIGVLGFLGLGLPPPDPDWGGMINENRQMAMFFPHMTVFPCLAISSLVLGFNLLADGLREISLRD